MQSFRTNLKWVLVACLLFAIDLRVALPQSASVPPNLLINGDFEMCDSEAYGTTYVPWWVVRSGTVDTLEYLHGYPLYWGVSLETTGTPGWAEIAQTFPTEPGKYYRVSFIHGRHLEPELWFEPFPLGISVEDPFSRRIGTSVHTGVFGEWIEFATFFKAQSDVSTLVITDEQRFDEFRGSIIDDVEVRQAVAARITGPYIQGKLVAGTIKDPVFPGETATFDGSRSVDYSGTSVQSYKWEIVSPSGKYTTATEPVVDCLMNERGIYTVALTVVSNDGLDDTEIRTVVCDYPEYRVVITDCRFTGKKTHSELHFKIVDDADRYKSVARSVEVVMITPGSVRVLVAQRGLFEEGKSYPIQFHIPADVETGETEVLVVAYRNPPEDNWSAEARSVLSVQFDPIKTVRGHKRASVLHPQLLPPFLGVSTFNVDTEVSVQTRRWQWLTPQRSNPTFQLWSLSSRLSTNLPSVISYAQSVTKTTAHWYISGPTNALTGRFADPIVNLNRGILSYYRLKSFSNQAIFDADFAGVAHSGESRWGRIGGPWWVEYRIIDLAFKGYTLVQVIEWIFSKSSTLPPSMIFRMLLAAVLFDPYYENLRVPLK